MPTLQTSRQPIRSAQKRGATLNPRICKLQRWEEAIVSSFGKAGTWDVKASTGWLDLVQHQQLWKTFINTGGRSSHKMRVQVRPTGPVKPIRVQTHPVVGLHRHSGREARADTVTVFQESTEIRERTINAMCTKGIRARVDCRVDCAAQQ